MMDSMIMIRSCFQRATSLRNGNLLSRLSLNDSTRVIRRWNHVEKTQDKPVKFTSSGAHIDYKATMNFYHDDPGRPQSHNFVLAGTGIFAVYYLIFLRDDIDADGGKELFKPVHETVPGLAIPLLQAAIAENKKFGYDTKKLEKKLAEYMENPEKFGGYKTKLIEN